MDDDEAYDYKFVKWMIKEKVDLNEFIWFAPDNIQYFFILK